MTMMVLAPPENFTNLSVYDVAEGQYGFTTNGSIVNPSDLTRSLSDVTSVKITHSASNPTSISGINWGLYPAYPDIPLIGLTLSADVWIPSGQDTTVNPQIFRSVDGTVTDGVYLNNPTTIIPDQWNRIWLYIPYDSISNKNKIVVAWILGGSAGTQPTWNMWVDRVMFSNGNTRDSWAAVTAPTKVSAFDPLTSGAAWTLNLGSPGHDGIVSGGVFVAGAVGGVDGNYFSFARYNTPAARNDHYIEGNFANRVPQAVPGGLMIGGSATLSEYVVAYFYNNKIDIYTVVGGIPGTSTLQVTTPWTAVAGTARFSRTGNVYTVTVNGGFISSWTDTTHAHPRDSDHRYTAMS